MLFENIVMATRPRAVAIIPSAYFRSVLKILDKGIVPQRKNVHFSIEGSFLVDPKRSAAAKKAWRTRRKRRAIGFYKDKQGRTRPITPPKKPSRIEDLLDVPEPRRWLSEKEKDALLQINSFSTMRKYRYGLNEKHVYYREAIQSLFKKGLIFYKKTSSSLTYRSLS